MQVVVKESYYDVPKYAMSAEIENNKEDESANKEQKPPKRPLYKRLLEHWQIGLKLIELIFSALSIGFVYEPIKITNLGKTHLHHVSLIYGTFIGFTIINSVFIFSRLLRDRIPVKTSILYSITAAVLFAITGILMIADKRQLTKHAYFYPHLHLIEMLIISATFSLLNAVIFIIDTVLTYKYAPDVE